ncbi:MAG: preprotein translocase subunit SecE [Actinomycetota bacterium]|nr:MAG: preprotein translocase subunit SecE [Actinomycetota bacterium]
MSDLSTETPERGQGGSDGPGGAGGSRGKGDRPALPARIALFIRQVIAELRKVIWPTRRELVTYTWVVIVFVVVAAAIVAVLDLVFTRAVLAIFGD